MTRVRYPGLAGHPGAALHARQAGGAGSVLSIETGSEALSRALIAQVECFTRAVSFGSVSSSIALPCAMSHASAPPAFAAAAALPPDLVRLSVGLEDASDLLADLDQALRRAGRATAAGAAAGPVSSAAPATGSPPA